MGMADGSSQQSSLKALQTHSYCFLKMPANLGPDLKDVFQEFAGIMGPAVDGEPLPSLSCCSGHYFGQSLTPGVKGSLWLHRQRGEEQQLWPAVRQDSGLSQDKVKRVFAGLESLATATVKDVFCEAGVDLPQAAGSGGSSGRCPLFAAHRAAAKAGVGSELSESVMALLHYGQPKGRGGEENEEPCPGHTDYTLFTLIPEHEWPGLQVLDMQEFRYVNVHDVAPGEGWVLCLAGECFGGGSLKELGIMPTMHRVVGTFTQRSSCAFFHYPHRASLLPGSSDTVEGYLSKCYRPSVNYKAHEDEDER